MSDEHSGQQSATGRRWRCECGVKQPLTCDRQQLGCTSRTTSQQVQQVQQQSGRERESVEPDKTLPDIRLIGRARPRCSQNNSASLGKVSYRVRGPCRLDAVHRVLLEQPKRSGQTTRRKEKQAVAQT